ncbi:MAG: PKD domain-containing protein, partial [Bacteroidia bacterium]
NARAFMGVGDIQLNNTLTLNGTNTTTVPAMWNYVDIPTTVTAGQNTSNFALNIPGDCYNFALMGLYFQSPCTQNCFIPCEAKPDFKWDGCNPIQFQGYNNAPANVVSWFWQFGDGQTSTLQNPLHYYGAAGSYKVCLTIVAVGSDGETCCEKICYEVKVCDPQPCKVIPDFFYAISINNPFTAFFYDATTFTGGSICDYRVDFGDGSLIYSGPTMPTSHTYPTTGSFLMCMTVTVCSYDANGNTVNKCDARVCKKVVISTIQDSRMAAPTDGTGLQVFPSPTNGQVNITIGDPNPVSIRIINSNGQEVASPVLSGKNQYQVDATSFAPGIYLVIVQSKDGSVQRQAFIRE